MNSFSAAGQTIPIGDLGDLSANSEGDLWCLDRKGKAYLFDTKQMQFYDYQNLVHTDNDSIQKVVQVVSLPKGVTWMVHERGLGYRIEDSGFKTGKNITLHRFKGKQVFRIFQDHDGDEWVLSSGGISIVGSKNICDSTVFVHIFQRDSMIWLSDGKRFFGKYNPGTEKIDPVELPAYIKNIVNIRSIGNSIIALGTTSSGLVLFDPQTQGFEKIDVNKAAYNGPNEVFSIFEDSYGDLWMLNRNSGIFRYAKNSGEVTWMQSPNTNPTSDNRVLWMEDPYGTIWMIPRGGNFCYFDRDQNELKYFYKNPFDQSTLISPHVRSFFIDRQRNIWFDNNKALGRITFLQSGFQLIRAEDDEEEVRSLLIDENGNCWAGIKHGKLKLFDKNLQCIGYVSEKGTLSKKPVLFNSNIYCLMQDNRKNIWIGTRMNGLYKFSPRAGTKYQFDVAHFVFNPEDTFSISDNNVYSLFQDNQNNIWVGTYGGGLNLIRYDEKGKVRFIHHGNQLKN